MNKLNQRIKELEEQYKEEVKKELIKFIKKTGYDYKPFVDIFDDEVFDFIWNKAVEFKEEEIIKMIYELKNPYPTDVFLPVSKEEYTAIHNLLLKNFNIPLDRISADIMRNARNILKEEVIKQIKGEGK